LFDFKEERTTDKVIYSKDEIYKRNEDGYSISYKKMTNHEVSFNEKNDSFGIGSSIFTENISSTRDIIKGEYTDTLYNKDGKIVRKTICSSFTESCFSINYSLCKAANFVGVDSFFNESILCQLKEEEFKRTCSALDDAVNKFVEVAQKNEESYKKNIGSTKNKFLEKTKNYPGLKLNDMKLRVERPSGSYDAVITQANFILQNCLYAVSNSPGGKIDSKETNKEGLDRTFEICNIDGSDNCTDPIIPSKIKSQKTSVKIERIKDL